MIEHLVTPKDKIIIELNRDEIELIASLAHLFLKYDPENSTAKMLIRSLVEQTNYVFSDPERHGVSSQLKIASTTTQQWGFLAKYLDFSYLDV